ncbi:MAG: tetratricopeptide repeat-containing sensor histidine kinase [bacterium]
MKSILFVLIFATTVIIPQRVSLIDSLSGTTVNKGKAESIDRIIDSAESNINTSITISINLAEKALKSAKEIKYYKGISNSLRLLGSAYRNFDTYDKALSFFLEALQIDLKYGTPQTISTSYNNVGIIYIKIEEYNIALKYFNKALKYCFQSDDEKSLANIYNNLGTVYNAINNYDKAFEFYNKALDIFERNKNLTGISKILNNIGYLKETINDYKAALEYYEKSLVIKRNLGKTNDIINTLQNLASTNLNLGNTDKAIELLNESISLALQIKHHKLLADGYLLLTYAYFYKHDLNKSSKYKNLFLKANEQLRKEERLQKIAELRIKYETDQKKNENEYLLNTYKLQQNYFIILASVFLFIIFLVSNRYRIKRKSHKLLTETASQLRTRVKFIEFLSAASSKLINLSVDQIDWEIRNTLRFITIFAENRCSFVFVLSKNQESFSFKHNWSKDHMFINKITEIQVKDLELVMAKLNNDIPIIIDEFNAPITHSFTLFKNGLNEAGIKSIVFIPIKLENTFWGVIGFGKESAINKIDEEVLGVYKLTAQIIANANKRKSKEEDLIVYSKELEEINKSKDKFYSMISHDLKSPFQGLLGFTSFILSELDYLSKDEIKEYVGTIETSAQNLFNLIENLLNWTRFEAGRIQFVPEKFNFYDLQIDVFNLIKGLAFKKNISLNSTVDNKFEIFADRKMISSILVNLITNGIKFTKPGGKIDLSASISDSNVIIIISDTGVGMNEEKVNSLFKITTTISTPGTNNEKGTGLGLLLCKEMIEWHNGTIAVQSLPDKGSTFIITLPRLSISMEV